MADQASVKKGGTPRVGAPSESGTDSSGNGVVGSIANFGNDVATLVELQAKLASADLKETTGRAVAPLGVVAVAGAVALAALIVGLLGIADLLALLLNVSAGTSKLIIAAFSLITAGLLVYVSLRSLMGSLDPLRRSHEEFIRNFSWLKTVLVYSGRAYPSRRL